jgi:hypothetical protein
MKAVKTMLLMTKKEKFLKTYDLNFAFRKIPFLLTNVFFVDASHIQ